MVRIEPGSRACTAFIFPFGTFQYIRMPFELANAGSVYSRMLYIDMKEVDRNFWTSYLDYILTYRGTFWAFNPGSVGACSCRDQDTTVQDQAVPVRGRVPGTKNQQGGRLHET